MVYLNIKYVIETRNYEFFNTGTGLYLRNVYVIPQKQLWVLNKQIYDCVYFKMKEASNYI